MIQITGLGENVKVESLASKSQPSTITQWSPAPIYMQKAQTEAQTGNDLDKVTKPMG